MPPLEIFNGDRDDLVGGECLGGWPAMPDLMRRGDRITSVVTNSNDYLGSSQYFFDPDSSLDGIHYEWSGRNWITIAGQRHLPLFERKLHDDDGYEQGEDL